MPRITFEQLKERILAGDLSEAEAKKYFNGNPKESSPFAPALAIDETEVDLGDRTERAGSAFFFNFLNSSEREGRRRRFEDRTSNGDASPVLLSEGDSWFQFPLLLQDVVDVLGSDFRVWSLDAAGDTLENMVFSPRTEYLKELRQLRSRFEVRAVLLSGAGNDVIGKMQSGESVLEKAIKPFDPARADESAAAWYIDTAVFADQVSFIERAHVKVIEEVTSAFPNQRVICHGYDYSIPGGFTGDDRRTIYARRDQWLGKPFEAKGFPHDRSQPLREAIVRQMLDRLDAVQKALCGGNQAGGRFANAYHLDLRGTLDRDEWNDEIHPTNAGFKKIGAKFKGLIDSLP